MAGARPPSTAATPARHAWATMAAEHPGPPRLRERRTARACRATDDDARAPTPTIDPDVERRQLRDGRLRRRAVRPRRPPGAAPRRRPVHRAPGRHRGRVPPAAPRAGRARRRLDRRHRRATPRTPWPSSPRSPRPPAREVLDGLIQRRDQPDPATYIGSRQGQELRDIVVADRRRHRHLRRRADARPAAPPRGRRQGQGRRPDRADPRHLRPARQEPRGQGAGRARADAVHAAAAARLGRVAVPAGRRPASRRCGGIGTRGPGETKIETDRRRIRTRMAKLRREIARHEDRPRHQAPGAPARTRCPSVAIAGYTNAGKSSLLNRLTGAGVLVENALFATLDPTVRRAADRRRPRLHPDRHRRLRPAPAAPAGRGVPLDAGGGRRGRPASCTSSTARDADPEAQLAAVREVLADVDAHARARDGRGQQGRRSPTRWCSTGCARREKHASWSRRAPGRASTSCATLIERDLPRPGGRGRRPGALRPRATWCPGCTTRATASPGAPARRAPGSGPGSTRRSPPSCRPSRRRRPRPPPEAAPPGGPRPVVGPAVTLLAGSTRSGMRSKHSA